MIALLFKAETLGLFDATVPVKGHVRRGTFVAPYQATRKKAPQPAPAADLFGTPEPKPEPAPAPEPKPEPAPAPEPAQWSPHDRDHFVARQAATIAGRWWQVGIRQPDRSVVYEEGGQVHMEPNADMGWQDLPWSTAEPLIDAARTDPRKNSQRYYLGVKLARIDREGGGNFAERIATQVKKERQDRAARDAQSKRLQAVYDNPAAYGYQKSDDLPVNQVVQDPAGNQFAIYDRTWGRYPGREALVWPLKPYAGEEGGYEASGPPPIWKVCPNIPPAAIIAAAQEEQRIYEILERRAEEERRQAEDERRQAEDERRQKKARAEAKTREKEARAHQKLVTDMRKERARLGGAPAPQPYDEADLDTWHRLTHFRDGTGSAAAEKMVKILEERLRSDPARWAPGDGVGFKVASGTRGTQISRGFRITEVNPTDKTAVIEQVADTGLTVTGGDHDRFGSMALHLDELVRDHHYDASPKPDGPVLYRAGILHDKNPQGIFLSDRKKTAEEYINIDETKGGPPRKIGTYRLREGIKIKDATTRYRLVKELDKTWDKERVNQKHINKMYRENGGRPINGTTPEGYTEMEAERRIRIILEKQGYAAVHYRGGGESDQAGEYQVFNKKDLIPDPPEQKTKSIHEYLVAAGLTDDEARADAAANPALWKKELVRAAVAYFDSPVNTAARAARAAKGGYITVGAIARAEKINTARRAWLADQ